MQTLRVRNNQKDFNLASENMNELEGLAIANNVLVGMKKTTASLMIEL